MPSDSAMDAAMSDALGIAQGVGSSWSQLERALSNFQSSSTKPVWDYARLMLNAYQAKEPDRVKHHLASAMAVALGASTESRQLDRYLLENALVLAQDHSSMPLPDSITQTIRSEYLIHEPEMRDNALREAFKYAGRGKWSIAGYWFDIARDHSHGFDKAITYLKILKVELGFAPVPAEYASP